MKLICNEDETVIEEENAVTRTKYGQTSNEPETDYDSAMLVLLGQRNSPFFDARLAIALHAKIITRQDISKRKVIYGGYKRNTECKGKQYPFQGSSTIGFAKRKIKITLPRINLWPPEKPGAGLKILNENCEEDESFLEIY